jgi:hypothetical protein
MQCHFFILLCFATAIAPPPALGSHICANAIAVLALGLHHTPLVLAYSSFSLYWPHISSLYGSSYGSSLISCSYHHSGSYHHSCSYHGPPSDHRTHAGCNQDAPRGHGHNSRNTMHTSTVTRFNCNFLIIGTSTWTQRWLTDSTPTRRANLHAHDPLTPLLDDDLHETPGTAPRHHLSHQRSYSSTVLPTTTPCRPLHSPPRGDSGRLPGASSTLDLRPRSDINCSDSSTDQSHKAK